MSELIFNMELNAESPAPVANDELLEPVKARAVLAWVGATFSDGTECTQEIAEKLVKSVDFSKFSPPLLIDHDWSVDVIKGKMVNIELSDDKEIIAEFDITDPETANKIASGEWSAISVTFESESFEIQECSIVAVPALKGAKIEAQKPTANADDEKSEDLEIPADMKDIDDKPESVDVPELEEAEVPESTEELAEEDTKVKNSMVKKPNIVDNAMITNLKKENADLRKQVMNLEAKMLHNQLLTNATAMVKNFVNSGLTTPAMAEKETAFLFRIGHISPGLVEKYQELKENCAVKPSILQGRLSVPNAQPVSAEDAFIEYATKYDENRGTRK